MKLSIEITDAEAESLEATARSLGIRKEELVRAAIADLLGRPDENFLRVARRVVAKNAELYERLS